MKVKSNTITVFPTELAKRQQERIAVLKEGIVNTSCQMTYAKLISLCERKARHEGFLKAKRLGTTKKRFLLEETVLQANKLSPKQPLFMLSSAALIKILDSLITTFAFLAENEATLIHWLLEHEEKDKLHGFGVLLKTWRNICKKKNIADRFEINRALLRLVKSDNLPPELNGKINFVSVRWLNPFEERFICALKTHLGENRVKLFSALPSTHADMSADRLCSYVRSELECGNEEQWQEWFEDFADALEIDDDNILMSESKNHVFFFISANPYGEIEDVARRIAKNIEAGDDPSDIAIILRELSPYTDIVPDVFKRFGIPYWFRRGTPAAAHPSVKTLLALLTFPSHLTRERLCDLLQTEYIQWPNLDEQSKQELVKKIKTTYPPRLSKIPDEIATFFKWHSDKNISLAEQVKIIIDQHALELPENVLSLLADMDQETAQSLPLKMMFSIFEELLENITLKDENELSKESGITIINPMDAAGLRFKSVFIAGMDEYTFPKIPKPDTLLKKTERTNLLEFLQSKNISCPRLALSETKEALIKEEILLLCSMGTASENLTLSYACSDSDGKERASGTFFERMVWLTGIKEPEKGESFNTIIPPKTIRALDEARQTKAWTSKDVPERSPLKKSDIAPLIQQWVNAHPEFSATSLECLARNRYVFFIERILGIKSERQKEDDIDLMDKGSILHRILEKVYSAVARQSDWYAKKTTSGWQLAQAGEIPLAVFEPSKKEQLLSLAQKIAEEELDKTQEASERNLGHPTIWSQERQKIIQLVRTYVNMDLKTAKEKNRYPALFEKSFGRATNLPVTLTYEGKEIHTKGKIDRIDLIFDDNGNLDEVLVIDYKGKSRNDPIDLLEKKISTNLDCQLALYTFAVQQCLFGNHNTKELNQMVSAVYHLQEHDLRKMTTHFDKKHIKISQKLSEKFHKTLFSNVGALLDGDLATEPLIAGYEDYSHICRTETIDQKEFSLNS